VSSKVRILQPSTLFSSFYCARWRLGCSAVDQVWAGPSNWRRVLACHSLFFTVSCAHWRLGCGAIDQARTGASFFAATPGAGLWRATCAASRLKKTCPPVRRTNPSLVPPTSIRKGVKLGVQGAKFAKFDLGFHAFPVLVGASDGLQSTRFGPARRIGGDWAASDSGFGSQARAPESATKRRAALCGGRISCCDQP
jgi:hypothetical protein